MFTPPTGSHTNSSLRFTYRQPTLKSFFKAVGMDSLSYCKHVQPIECDPKSTDLTLQKKCQEIFTECLENARQIERWHRAN